MWAARPPEKESIMVPVFVARRYFHELGAWVVVCVSSGIEEARRAVEGVSPMACEVVQIHVSRVE